MKISAKEKNIYAKGLEDDFTGNEKEWWAIHHKINGISMKDERQERIKQYSKKRRQNNVHEIQLNASGKRK